MTHRAKVLWGLLVLSAIAGVVTTAARAAADNSAVPVTSEPTAFDPFLLRTYRIQDSPTRTSLQVSVSAVSRTPIRIPFRPVLRSPFRPDWESQVW
jgi:hypothetical protein